MKILRRLPFTIFMLVSLLVVALLSHTISGKLSPESTELWGFGLHNLWDGRIYTLVTSTFFVRDLQMLLGVSFMLLYSVAVCEWLAGSKRAFLLYWSADLLAPLLAALLVLLPLYLAGTAIGQSLAWQSDVGPSAGAFGCIGGAVNRLPRRYGRWLFIGVLAYLIGKLIIAPELFADTAHLFAFPLGALGDYWLVRRKNRPVKSAQ